MWRKGQFDFLIRDGMALQGTRNKVQGTDIEYEVGRWYGITESYC